VGNGAGVLLSRDELARSGLDLGAAVAVRVRPGRVDLLSVERRVRDAVSERFAALVDEFVERYRDVFARLAGGPDR
jgi:hypothetical protein